MKLTARMREKYRAKPVRRSNRRGSTTAYGLHPAGSEDIRRLCDAVDALESMVRYLQARVNTDAQNETERRLFFVVS